MLPLLAPLLSLGIGLVDKLVDKTTGEKDVLKGTLTRLATDGNKEQLEAEVQRLSILIESDKAQAAINVEQAKVGDLGWRKWLGYLCVISLAYGTLGVAIINVLINLANASLEMQIASAPSVDMAPTLTILASILGIATADRIKNNG